MDETERHEKRDRTDPSTVYATAGVGLAFLIASVLVAVTAGVPAAAFPFLVASFACLGWSVPKALQNRRSLPAPKSKEKELLSAIRDNGGSINPAEAAMGTSLTVREADAMLSELAAGGHLAVEGRGGTLFYTLPGREDRTLGGG